MGETSSPYAVPASPLAEPHAAGGMVKGASAGLPRASPAVAALLSLLVPGLGQVYAGRVLRGVAWIAATWLVGICLTLLVYAGAKALAVALPVLLLDALSLRVATSIDALWIVRVARGPRLSWWKVSAAGLLLAMLSEAHGLAIRTFVVEAFKIPSGSMIPTLLVGDHVFVATLRTPARGDLLVFPFPEHPEQDFVKRVLGMPGDRLTFRGGHPVVNGVEVPSCFVGAASYADGGPQGPEMHSGKVYLETLGDRRYLTFYDETEEAYFPQTQGPYSVKEGEVFVVGDNRFNAHDSRMWYGGRGGGVPLATGRGVPIMVWLSVADGGGVDWARSGLGLDRAHLPRSMDSLRPALDRCLAHP